MFEAAELEQTTTRDELDGALESLRVDLLNAQFDLQNAPFSVVIQFAGTDWPLQSAALKSLHEWMDQRHIDTVALGKAGEEERARPPMWRYWRRLPPRGQMAVFIDGWATHLLDEAVQGKLGKGEMKRRIRHITQFEQALSDDHVLLLKYWFHLDKKTLKKRIKKADKDPERLWWVDDRERETYELYDEGMPIAEHILRETSEGNATWNIIGSANPNYALLTLAHDLHDRITERIASPPPSQNGSGAQANGDAPIGRTVLDTVDLKARLAKPDYDKKMKKLRARVADLSRRAFDEGISMVAVFEGWDAAGKGGAIRRLTWPMDVTRFRVEPIAAPTDEELARHYLWRFWRRLPAPGRLTIFDRSWYGRVLVERVEGLTHPDDWRRAYAEINDFETQLIENDMLVLKFWLHIDQDEQLARFEAREETAYKKYKITGEDYRNRQKWDAYIAAVDEMVQQTSTPDAPWHLVAANDKRSARIQVIQTYVEALRTRLGK